MIGSTVLLRRLGATGEVEFLLVHADGAWTAPFGYRRPGEPVYPAALRSFADVAGLVDRRLWAVDCTVAADDSRAREPGRWATFAVDVEPNPIGTGPYGSAWVPTEEALALVGPESVARQIAAVAALPPVRLEFRLMRDDDLADVARWQRAEHVRPWWDLRSTTEEAARARYGPRLGGDHPIRMWVVEVDGHAVGHIQDYRVASFPEYAEKTRAPEAVAIDYLIGEPDLVGRGLGTRMIWEFCRDVLRAGHPDARHVIASPSHRNGRSLRALAKAGFSQGLWIDPPARPGEPPDTEIVCTLDVRHWFG